MLTNLFLPESLGFILNSPQTDDCMQYMKNPDTQEKARATVVKILSTL